MFRLSLAVFLVAGSMIFTGGRPLVAQNKGAQERPDLRPGDRVEVIDMGKIREAEFVQFTTVGLIKVRFDDDSQLSFPPNKVRWPKGIAPKRDPLPAAQPATPPGTQPTAAPASGGGVKRKWQDATGQFSVEAEFVGMEGDKVQLKRTDGKFLTLPLDKLSATDQEVAKALALAAAAKGPSKEPENPFEANVSDKPTVATQPSASGQAAVSKVSLQGAPTITLDAPASWTASVNPSAAPAPAIGNRTASIPSRSGKDDFWEKADSLIVDAAHSWMWIGVKNEHGQQKAGWLERIDLAKGTVLPQIMLPTIMKPLVVDPSGKYLLTSREDDFFTKGKHLDLWEIDGDQLKPSSSFKPYDKGDGNNHNVQAVTWVEFIDGTHLFTLGSNGTLALWNLPSLKPEYVIELGGWSKTCTLSPGRKQLAVATSSGVYVLDALSGNVLGKCEMKDAGPNLSIYRVAFSDDGSQLAAVGPLNLWVWNVADGKNTTSFSGTAMPIGHEAALSFGSHKHLIIDHRYAFDIERGLMTCHYTGSWSAAATYAGREWYLTEDGSRGSKVRSLMQFVLPGDAVVQKAKTVNEAELLAIKPGSKIALELNLPFDGAEIEKIRASVTTAFKNNGWEVVAPGTPADFTLTSSTSTGKSEEITYRTFGRGFGNEKVTVTYQHGEMVLMAPGIEKPIWQSKTTWGPPHHIHLKEGQTLAEATQTNPNPSYFMHPGIPRRLMKYPNGLSIVSADLSLKGMTVR